jgi:hypothetical protein
MASEIIKVLPSTSWVSPAIAGRNSIQPAPQIAPSPTVEVIGRQTLRPAPEDAVGKAGKQLDKAACSDRGDREQQQHRRDAGMTAGIAIRLGRGLQNTLRRGDGQCRDAAQIGHSNQEDDVGSGINRKRRPNAHLGYYDAGDRRPEETSGVEDDRIDCQRRGQRRPID